MSGLRIVFMLAAAVALTACATTDERGAVRATPKPGTLDTNHEYVAQVEAIARRRGIDVQWVNMPVKRTPRED